jgi:hypothetical protein
VSPHDYWAESALPAACPAAAASGGRRHLAGGRHLPRHRLLRPAGRRSRPGDDHRDGALEQVGAVLLAQREADGAQRHDVAVAVDDIA